MTGEYYTLFNHSLLADFFALESIGNTFAKFSYVADGNERPNPKIAHS